MKFSFDPLLLVCFVGWQDVYIFPLKIPSATLNVHSSSITDLLTHGQFSYQNNFSSASFSFFLLLNV